MYKTLTYIHVCVWSIFISSKKFQLKLFVDNKLDYVNQFHMQNCYLINHLLNKGVITPVETDISFKQINCTSENACIVLSFVKRKRFQV